MLAENVRLRLLNVLPDAKSVDVFGVFAKADEIHAPAVYATWPELHNSTLFYEPPSFTKTPGVDYVGLDERAEVFYQQWTKVEACLIWCSNERRKPGCGMIFSSGLVRTSITFSP